MITEIRLAESRCWDQYTPASQPQEDLRGARLLRVSQRVFAALVTRVQIARARWPTHTDSSDIPSTRSQNACQIQGWPR